MEFLISTNLIPILMIIFGALFINHAPKEVNGIYGYRTPMSKKNKDTWEFAHHYCGRLWLILGIVLFIISFAASTYLNNLGKASLDLFTPVFVVTQVIAIIITIILTEAALRKSFDKNGNLK